jgi:hypothetical protein
MLSEEDNVKLEKIICKASNSELYEIIERVEKEIRLSEICIKEGQEERI